jgi:hypothetical protein
MVQTGRGWKWYNCANAMAKLVLTAMKKPIVTAMTRVAQGTGGTKMRERKEAG